MSIQSAGGRAKGKIIRDTYIANPNKCLFCQKPILPYKDQKLADVKTKKFCNRSCAAQHNNRLSPKRIRFPDGNFQCERCLETLPLVRNKTGVRLKRRFCTHCERIARIETRGFGVLETKSKRELFDCRPNWQSARSSIRAHANLVFERSKCPSQCFVCGYSLHVEIAHIKSVSSFPDTALISEINAIANLVGLCPNHHWEYDNDLLRLSADTGSAPVVFGL